MKTNREKLRKLVRISLKIQNENDISIEGNASAIDDETDRMAEAWIYDQLRIGNVWAWCEVTVEVSYGHCDLTRRERVGGCSYSSRNDFMVNGPYQDMVRAAVESLAAQLEDVANDHEIWEHDMMTCLWCVAKTEE